MTERINIIGVPISAVNMESAMGEISGNLDVAKEKYICASNVHTTVMARENPNYLEVQRDSFLTLPDGKPLSVVGKKRGAVEMGQVRGLDLMKNIFSNCQLNGYKHYFYGNTKENLDTLIEKLKQDYPTLNIVGYKPSVFRELTEDELESLAAEIKKTGADFLWVALGAPRQEFFCSRIQGKTGAVPVGVGGAFNVLAGIVPDAPKLMKKLSLEWLYRFIKEPRRLFKRYFTTNFKFIFYLLMEKKR
ncbi:MAG: WecB/TagA/CpsF family glycosyltransferase [Oscillospiraceae bacterium]